MLVSVLVLTFSSCVSQHVGTEEHQKDMHSQWCQLCRMVLFEEKGFHVLHSTIIWSLRLHGDLAGIGAYMGRVGWAYIWFASWHNSWSWCSLWFSKWASAQLCSISYWYMCEWEYLMVSLSSSHSPFHLQILMTYLRRLLFYWKIPLGLYS
jgi:hypothetical protein